MWLFMQEHLACLERGNVGFGLSEDSVKRFIVGEAVCDRGMLNFPYKRKIAKLVWIWLKQTWKFDSRYKRFLLMCLFCLAQLYCA